MNALSIFGLISVSLMLLFYALEDRSHWFVFAFAVSCLSSSIYGFLQGAWPFGGVEAVWTLVALNRWRKLRGNSAVMLKSPSTTPVSGD